jgi:ribonuclease HI|tara:strand:+ start:2878 stop:3333 length:456 start_codon:yes stop_codon:yes gene_type:complete
MTYSQKTKEKIHIYTDGSSLGNPGDGGWAAVLIHQSSFGLIRKEISGFVPDATSNQMEVTAVIRALEALKMDCAVTLYSDSKYVVNAINKWIVDWEKKNWKDVKNVDLMKRLAELKKIHEIQANWIKGHSGHVENERCDVLAVAAAKSKKN